jgi:DNA-binding NarL/FixJ family response regulator
MTNCAPSVFHIEDQPMWCNVVGRVIKTAQRYRYFGAAGTAERSLAACNEQPPDIVLLDLRLPDADGLDTISHLRMMARPPAILVLTAYCSEVALYCVKTRRIAGLVSKSAILTKELPEAIDCVWAGGNYLSTSLRPELRRFSEDPKAFFKILSNREIALLAHLGRGDSNEEIADRIGISEATVRSHREHVLRKLGIHSSEKLMRWAAERGFVNFERRVTPV